MKSENAIVNDIICSLFDVTVFCALHHIDTYIGRLQEIINCTLINCKLYDCTSTIHFFMVKLNVHSLNTRAIVNIRVLDSNRRSTNTDTNTGKGYGDLKKMRTWALQGYDNKNILFFIHFYLL